MVLITPRSVSSVGRLDALAVDTNFAKKAEGWVSSCGDVTFWLELMAPKGREFDPHTDHLFDPFLYFTLLFFFLQKRSIQREEVEVEVEEAYLSLLSFTSEGIHLKTFRCIFTIENSLYCLLI